MLEIAHSDDFLLEFYKFENMMFKITPFLQIFELLKEKVKNLTFFVVRIYCGYFS